jgi:RHS repeat-associated protein
VYDSGVRSRSTGKERDAETGLDYFGARYFSGAQGRFTSPDPGPWELLNPQSYNAYTYALNNPLRYGDDEGETAQDRINAANDLLGTSYISGGGHPGNRNESCGLDCSGLVYKAFKADPDNKIAISGTASNIADELQSHGQFSVSPDDAQPGDAIFWSDNGRVVHTGIVVDVRDGKIYFVHAPRPGKKVNQFYVTIKTGAALGSERFRGVGRPIETTGVQGHNSPSQSLLGRFTMWWNSWSLFGTTPSQPSKKPDPEADRKPKRKGKKLIPRGNGTAAESEDVE